MTQAKTGDKVRICYFASTKDGTVVDASHEKEFFEFTIGQKQLFSKFETAIIGMKEGQTKTFSIPPESAFGNYRKNLNFVVRSVETESPLILICE